MKLIIDVPEEVYEALKSIAEDATSLDPYSLADIIVNRSKPLDDLRQQGEWIPITMRPIEEEEKIDFPDATFMFDCPMPEDGQEILISTKYGIEFDTCFADDGYYLDSDRDWEEVYAWMPLPEPYKKGGADMRKGEEGEHKAEEE